ncbi:MAG: putative glycoside hydrolase [Thiogranum sp.]
MKLRSFPLYSNLLAIFVNQAHARARVLNFQKILAIGTGCLFSLLAHSSTLTDSTLVNTSSIVSSDKGAAYFITSKSTNAEGKVRTLGIANNDMAPYLEPQYYDWLNQHFDAMQVYSPWFDDITEFYGNGYVYKDLYAIYDCRLARNPADDLVSPDAPNSICAGDNQANLLGLYEAAMQAENDPAAADWILKDNDGNRLYIPFRDPHDRLTQFAADIRNPAFRQFWLSQMTSVLTSANGVPLDYRGIFVDDVNMDLEKSISNDTCRLIDVPSNPDCNWSTDISAVEWADSLVTFVQAIRATFPSHEIIHNSVWFHTAAGESYVNAQIAAADIISIERGVHDPGLNANIMPAFFAFNDKVHKLGRRISHYIHVYGVDLYGVLGQLRELEHGLAGWLLVSNGNDLYGADRFVHPGNWWEGFDVDLGEATTPRYITDDGLYRRDFTSGTVLLNPTAATPSATAVHISLPGYFRTLNGDCLNEVTLPPASGRVLFTASSCTPTYNTHFTSRRTQ